MSHAPLRRPRLGPLAALLASGVVLLLSSGPAPAAPYTVWSCQGPGGEPLPGTAWVGTVAGGAEATTDCASGMRAALPAGRSTGRAAGVLTFAAPAGTRITGFELQRTLRASIGGLFSTGYAANVRSVDPTGPLGAGCAGGGLSLPSTCSVGDPLIVDGVSIAGITVSAACTQDGCPSATPAAEAVLTRSRVVLDDPQGPSATAMGGTLKETGRVVRSLVVTGADAGSGVAAITANVDGGGSATVDGGGTCVAPYAIARPCPASREASFGIDTGPLKPGDHVATGTVVDAAGTTTPWGPVPFTVPSGGSSDPGPAPAGSVAVPVSPATTPSGTPEPTAKLTLHGTSTKAGRRRPTGYLRTRGGVPLSNMTVRLTRTRSGAGTTKTIPMAAVRTGKNGRFVGSQLPEGAWTVAGAADVSSGTVTASIRLRTGLRVSATPSARRLRTGDAVVLSGRLTGAGPARAGVRVRIQTIIKGEYETVATVRTTTSGRWRWRYRFRKVSRPTLFAFRALVPGDGADWPWKPVSRRAAAVRVDPR